jgi:hypothetical protein
MRKKLIRKRGAWTGQNVRDEPIRGNVRELCDTLGNIVRNEPTGDVVSAHGAKDPALRCASGLFGHSQAPG